MSRECDVLVVGAGPTGLFLAYALTRMGVAVRLIDAKPGPPAHSRAMGVQARTLEFYRQFGLARRVIDAGIVIRTAHVSARGRERARLRLDEMGAGRSPYPYLLSLAQDIHESILIDELEKLGTAVEWGTRLTDVTQSDADVTATLQTPDGERQVDVPYLVGCDGAGSAVRHALGIDFGGGTTQGLFYVADVRSGRVSSDIRMGLGAETLALMLPVRTTDTHRIIGIVPDALADREDLGFDDVGGAGADLLGIEVREVNWFSTYRVHHRAASQFQEGRCFLAGDAAHIHSPVGGQGMNTGLGDAMNLGWKLAMVLRGAAPEALLDSYGTERIPFARILIATTDRAFGFLTGKGGIARFLRLRAMPTAIAAISGLRLTRRLLFRAISQIHIDYRSGPLSEGRAGRVRGGDRLPWVEAADNFAPLAALDWQVHVYGTAQEALRTRCDALGLPLHVFAPTKATRRAGLAPDAAYLLRPDGHVALALTRQDGEALEAYLDRHGLHPAAP